MSNSFAMKRMTAPEIRKRKGGPPIVALTAYHAHTARIIDPHVDFLLVGDSLGMVMHGYETTVPVPLELMIMHAQAVVRGSTRALVVVDMPFGSYEESPAIAFRNAARVMKETGAGAIKLEGGAHMAETIRYLADRGIPVMSHIGMTPQAINTIGSFKPRGRFRSEWAAFEADAKAVADAGAFAVVLEALAELLAARITKEIADPDHRHRRVGRMRRADPGARGHARPVAARAEIRQGICPYRRRHRGRREGLRERGPQPCLPLGGVHLSDVRRARDSHEKDQNDRQLAVFAGLVGERPGGARRALYLARARGLHYTADWEGTAGPKSRRRLVITAPVTP